MNCPTPPRPINEPTVTSPIVLTVAMRIPAMITGIASGTSTCQSTWRLENPMPTAESTTSAGTPASPAVVFLIRISNV